MQSMQYLFRGDAAARSIQATEADIEQKKQMEALKRESAYKSQAAGKVLPRRKRAAQA